MELRSVLLVTPPGTTAIRLAVERELRRRAWPLASSPAAADVLVLCGPLPSPTPPWLATLRSQLPPPGRLVAIPGPDAVTDFLAASPLHRNSDGRKEDDAAPASAHEGRGEHTEHAGHTEHTGHTEHHGEGMAERGDDRDGLRLDRWHLTWGPGLADWPGGLLLHIVAQGDVVQEARTVLVDAAPGSGPAYWNGPWTRAARGEHVTCGEAARHRCAAHLDSLGRLLAVAAWADPAARARRLRDAVLTAAPGRPPVDPALPRQVRALTRRVRRSRTLRWLTRGLGPLPAPRARALGITGPALAAGTRGAGDVYDRMRVWLEETDSSLDAFSDTGPLPSGTYPGPRGDTARPAPSAALLAAVPELLTGAEFACARLVLASLDPDPDELVPVGAAFLPAPPVVRGPSHG